MACWIGHKALCGVLNRPQSACSVLKLGLKVLCGVEICVNQITLERVGKNSTNHYGELEGFRRAYLRLTDNL